MKLRHLAISIVAVNITTSVPVGAQDRTSSWSTQVLDVLSENLQKLQERLDKISLEFFRWQKVSRDIVRIVYMNYVKNPKKMREILRQVAVRDIQYYVDSQENLERFVQDMLDMMEKERLSRGNYRNFSNIIANLQELDGERFSLALLKEKWIWLRQNFKTATERMLPGFHKEVGAIMVREVTWTDFEKFLLEQYPWQSIEQIFEKRLKVYSVIAADMKNSEVFARKVLVKYFLSSNQLEIPFLQKLKELIPNMSEWEGKYTLIFPGGEIEIGYFWTMYEMIQISWNIIPTLERLRDFLLHPQLAQKQASNR